MDDETMVDTDDAMTLLRATDADPRGTVLMLLRVLGGGLATATRERDEARAEAERLRADAEVLSRFVLGLSFNRCGWDYDEETGEYAEGGCEEAATHRVVGPHDMDCGSYCEAHAERTKRERCGEYTHRFQLSQVASCDGLSEARAAAIRARGAGGGA